MMIRFFLLVVVIAGGYLLAEQRPDIRSSLSETLSRVKMTVAALYPDQPDQTSAPDSQSLATKPEQSEAEIQNLRQEIVQLKVQLNQLQSNANQRLEPEKPQPPVQPKMAVTESAEATSTSQTGQQTRQQLMGLAERMEMRALQYGR